MNIQTKHSRYDKGYRQIHFNLKQTKERSKLTQIYISINVQGERLRVYSKLRVEPEFWDKNENRCLTDTLMSKRVQNRMQYINSQLDSIERQIEYSDYVCAEKGIYLTKDCIRKILASINGKAKRTQNENALTIMKEIAGNYRNSLNRRGRIGEANTGRTYMMAITRLENFVLSINRKDLKFSDFDRRFVADFTDYLTKCTFRHGSDIRHYTSMTVASTISAVRNILRKAYDMELSDNPCRDIFDTIVTHDVSDKIYLDEMELKRLAKVKVKDESERCVRDLFMIASYTGLRISDINCLNEAAFSQDCLTMIQTKTKSLVHIPILNEVSELIETYRKSGFPHLDRGKANVCIKDLAKRAGINDTVIMAETRGGVRQYKHVPKCSQVSFHTARRSCITNLFKRGYSANYIMSLSGHKSIASFQRYVKSSDEEMSQAFIKELRKRRDIASI